MPTPPRRLARSVVLTIAGSVCCVTTHAATPAAAPVADTASAAYTFDTLPAAGLGENAQRMTGALRLDSYDAPPLDGRSDFSVQCWVRTTADADQQMVLLAKKAFDRNSVFGQKQPGWAFLMANGTWAWHIGSGSRRLSYLRDNGEHMPLNDGRWHQLVMTYDAGRALVRLYYDGTERAIYNLRDSDDGFDFASPRPLTVGWDPDDTQNADDAPTIEQGRLALQGVVDAFNALGLPPLKPDEFLHVIADTQRLVERRAEAAGVSVEDDAIDALVDGVRGLSRSPYTVHQNLNFTRVAPLATLYELIDGSVTLRDEGAARVHEQETLDPPDFDIDGLAVWDRVLTRDDVSDAYTQHFPRPAATLEPAVDHVTAGCWNIWHGGIHFNPDDHGFDSRDAVVHLIQQHDIDVVMMQETYSAGDYIAAELGYYFVESVDWDYLNQGANISVLSRYPIEEVYVPEGASFNNVAVKVRLSETQHLYVMSNWYGMGSFPAVYDFHAARFAESGHTPTLFAGDFNAVPHTDGGDSPASVRLTEAGFTDAFREQFPDPATHPGASHRSGRRIDQLFYKGAALRNASTRLIDTWPLDFPSDHYLIVTRFDFTAPAPDPGDTQHP